MGHEGLVDLFSWKTIPRPAIFSRYNVCLLDNTDAGGITNQLTLFRLFFFLFLELKSKGKIQHRPPPTGETPPGLLLVGGKRLVSKTDDGPSSRHYNMLPRIFRTSFVSSLHRRGPQFVFRIVAEFSCSMRKRRRAAQPRSWPVLDPGWGRSWVQGKGERSMVRYLVLTGGCSSFPGRFIRTTVLSPFFF